MRHCRLKSNNVVKNLGMDWVLLAISALYFLRGFWKGFVSMLFSLVGTFVVVAISWSVCGMLVPVVDGWLGQSLSNTLTQILNGAIPGEFSDLSSLQAALGNSKYALLFNVLLSKVIGSLTIDGIMSAGQILSPTITTLLVKVLAFVLVFVILFFAVRFLAWVLNKIIKKCGLSLGNRVLGGAIGLVKGLVVFAVLYFAISTLANFLLNETLLSFVQSGVVSKFLYESLIIKILNLIY